MNIVYDNGFLEILVTPLGMLLLFIILETIFVLKNLGKGK